MRNINLDVFTFSSFVCLFTKYFIIKVILIKFLFNFKKSLLDFLLYFWSQLTFCKIHFHILTFKIFKKLVIWAVIWLTLWCSHWIHIIILVKRRIYLVILSILAFYNILINRLFALLYVKFRRIIIGIAISSNNWELLIKENIIRIILAPFLTLDIADILIGIYMVIRSSLIKPSLNMIIRNLVIIIWIINRISFESISILIQLMNDR